MIAYKFLRAGRNERPSPAFAGSSRMSEPGPWVEARSTCRSGIHASRLGICRSGSVPLSGGRARRTRCGGAAANWWHRAAAYCGESRAWDDECPRRSTRGCAPTARTSRPQRRRRRCESWDAVVEPSIPEGPALLGFVAARIAEEISGSRRTTLSVRAKPRGCSSGSVSKSDPQGAYSRNRPRSRKPTAA